LACLIVLFVPRLWRGEKMEEHDQPDGELEGGEEWSDENLDD
jgi:hypothetical protein